MKRTALYITFLTLLSSLFCCTPRTHTGFIVDSHFVEDHPDSAMTRGQFLICLLAAKNTPLTKQAMPVAQRVG